MGKLSVGMIILGLIFYGLNPLKPLKTKELIVSVEIVDEKNKIFESVYNDKKTFEYDDKTKKYKLCVGTTSPTTYMTDCEAQVNSVHVLYFKDNKKNNNPTHQLCLYLEVNGNGCRVGNEDSEFYNMDEIKKIRNILLSPIL